MEDNRKHYMGMREVTHEDHLEFVKNKEFVVIENTKIKLQKKWSIKAYGPQQIILLNAQQYGASLNAETGLLIGEIIEVTGPRTFQEILF